MGASNADKKLKGKDLIVIPWLCLAARNSAWP